MKLRDINLLENGAVYLMGSRVWVVDSVKRNLYLVEGSGRITWLHDLWQQDLDSAKYYLNEAEFIKYNKGITLEELKKYVIENNYMEKDLSVTVLRNSAESIQKAENVDLLDVENALFALLNLCSHLNIEFRDIENISEITKG